MCVLEFLLSANSKNSRECGRKNQRASAGGSIDNGVYWACITSYDYDAPISESGDYGQPGIGGPNKFDVRCPQ